MADGKVLLEVVVEGKNVKVVQRQVEGVTDAINQNTASQEKNVRATNKAADAHQHFDRGLKGLHQSTLSSGKALSKQRDLIGSSSFVGAYATLAANLYAATAAFTAFKNAADTQKVIKSIDILGTTTGTNIVRIGENIQRITGYGLSMSESMKAASLGVSAGFDSNQLETLAKVAKGASAALGRDLSDSYDRLIRGVAKLEPEILDELGIMVKIDKAVADYALTLKKNASELTNWERTQAFMNAVNTQGISKFGLLADAVETSPYDKLSASLDNLSKSTLDWIANTAKIPEFFNYLSENLSSLTGAIALFVSTISRQMLPILYEGPQRAARVAEMAAKDSKRYLEEAKSAGASLGQSLQRIPAGYKSVLDSLRAGTASVEEQKKAVNSLTKSISYYKNALASGQTPAGKTLSPEQVQEYTARQKELEQELVKVNEVQKGTSAAQVKSLKAVANTQIQVAKANAITAASNLDLKGTINSIKAAYTGYIEQTLVAEGATVSFFAKLRAGSLAGLLGLRALGAGLLAALPLIGLLVTFGPIIYDWFKNKFFPETEVQKRQTLIEGLFKKVTDLTSFLAKTDLRFEMNATEPNFDKSIEGLKLIAASFKEIRTSIVSLLNEIEDSATKIAREVLVAPAEAKVTESRTKLQEAKNRVAELEKTIAEKQKNIQNWSGADPRGRQQEVEALKALINTVLPQAQQEALQYEAEVVKNRANLVKVLGDAKFETIVTRVEAAASLIPSAIQEQIDTIKNSKMFQALPEQTQSVITTEVTNRLQMAGKEYAAKLEILQDLINTAVKASGGKLSSAEQAEFSSMYKEIELGFRNAMSGATGNLEQFIGKANGMKDEVQAVQKAISDAANKMTTPYDKPLEALNALNTGIQGTGPEVALLNEALGKIFDKEYKINVGFDRNKLQKALQAGANATRSLVVEQGKLQNLESLASGLNQLAGVDLAIQQQKSKVIDLQIAQKQADLELARNSNVPEEQKRALIQEINNLSTQKLSITQAEIAAGQKVLDLNNKILSSQKEAFDLSMQTQKNRLILSKPSGQLSTKEEDRLVQQQYADRLSFAKKEYDLKVEGINLEYKLLEAQYSLFRAQAVANKLPLETIKIIDDAMAQMDTARSSSLSAASAQFENSVSNLQIELQKASIDLGSKVDFSLGGVMSRIGETFYNDIKNTLPLMDSLANSFTSAVDAAAEAFVDAIVEGKNVFKAIGSALRDSLRDTLAEAAKSQLKLGIKLLFENIPGFDILQGPQEQIASSALSIAESNAAIASALTNLTCTCSGYMPLSSTTTAIPSIPGFNSSISENGVYKEGYSPSPSSDTLNMDLATQWAKYQKKDEQWSGLQYDKLDLTSINTAQTTKEVGWWGKAQEYATNNVATIATAGFASIVTAIAAGKSTKKSIIGGILGIAGSVIGGMYGGPAGAAAGGQVGAMVGSSFKTGGVMSSSGPMPLHRYASGGIANSPQLAMFGEGRKPEAYVPLPDGRSIPVTMSSNGGNVNNISVNVAVDNKGNAQTNTGGANSDEYSQKLGVAISNAVKSEIANQQRPGGLLYRGRR